MTVPGSPHLKTLLQACGIVFLAVCMAACGYRFSGGGRIPGGVNRLTIKTFENRSGEIGIESVITNDIIYEFTRTGKASVTKSKTADAVLTGVIRAARSSTISHVSSHATADRRITVTVDVKLARPSGTVLWSGSDISASEEYTVADDKIVTEQNKKSAVAKLSSRLAQRIYYRMTDDF
ncbi:MAG: hypothetical protein KGY42_01585 [Desulfobacterales bacterium]|nr:hypothetical protein [Desulfobacterales bacterium]MBS3755684.1 hypothetical protein [Desulfobacterales bacterium]